jgi:lipid-A-disaccharide synthase
VIQRVLMIAGEASGDLHGAGVVRELRAMRPGLDVFGIGGDNMKKEGMDVVVHISRVAVMGFVEVVRHLRVILGVERQLERLLDVRRPDIVVLIDYPGFNLRFAERAKSRNIPVLYYISPQVWAWHRGRVKKMKALIDAMKVVFPFEVDIYRQAGIDVEFVGHPIAERIGASNTRDEFFSAHGLEPARPLVALLPGSRMQEIDRIFPTMVLAAAELHSRFGAQCLVGVAPNLGHEPYARLVANAPSVRLVEHATYDLMCHANAAIVTSGTATLEAGWFTTPMVIVYRTSPITFFIGRLLVDVPYIGLVNFVAGKKVVPELIQGQLTVSALVEEVGRLLTDSSYAGAMRRDLTAIRGRLGGPGASRRVATGVISLGEAA